EFDLMSFNANETCDSEPEDTHNLSDSLELIKASATKLEQASEHNPQQTIDPTKHYKFSSQKIRCPWKLNVSYQKAANCVKINLFNNNHSHTCTSMINQIALQFHKLTPEMLANIKKYITQGRLDSASIYPLIKHNYPIHPLQKQDLYNTVYTIWKNNNPGDIDVFLMFQTLLT
ncbi:18887_t:CDS:2, partial [Racocetra persica]